MSDWGLGDVRRAMALRPSRRLQLPSHRPAAVLVPLLHSPDGISLLFTVRAPGLRRHGGQVSFPGGRLDEGETVVEAALREAEEEVGLRVTPEQVLGTLDDRSSPYGLVATPVVAELPWPSALRLQDQEVAEVFTLPLATLAATEPLLLEVEFEGTVRLLHRYLVADRDIWGLTGNVVKDLLDRLVAVGAAAEA